MLVARQARNTGGAWRLGQEVNTNQNLGIPRQDEIQKTLLSPILLLPAFLLLHPAPLKNMLGIRTSKYAFSTCFFPSFFYLFSTLPVFSTHRQHARLSQTREARLCFLRVQSKSLANAQATHTLTWKPMSTTIALPNTAFPTHAQHGRLT